MSFFFSNSFRAKIHPNRDSSPGTLFSTRLLPEVGLDVLFTRINFLLELAVTSRSAAEHVAPAIPIISRLSFIEKYIDNMTTAVQLQRSFVLDCTGRRSYTKITAVRMNPVLIIVLLITRPIIILQCIGRIIESSREIISSSSHLERI